MSGKSLVEINIIHDGSAIVDLIASMELTGTNIGTHRSLPPTILSSHTATSQQPTNPASHWDPNMSSTGLQQHLGVLPCRQGMGVRDHLRRQGGGRGQEDSNNRSQSLGLVVAFCCASPCAVTTECLLNGKFHSAKVGEPLSGSPLGGGSTPKEYDLLFKEYDLLLKNTIYSLGVHAARLSTPQGYRYPEWTAASPRGSIAHQTTQTRQI
ncbi:hypothetical protein GGR53DRAFT_465008 [Hypoxylon sp. FL1150]|nr:hypothetical protein GGR53DRAFT_465008 [Hypoxylon sp. FL1150]